MPNNINTQQAELRKSQSQLCQTFVLNYKTNYSFNKHIKNNLDLKHNEDKNHIQSQNKDTYQSSSQVQSYFAISSQSMQVYKAQFQSTLQKISTQLCHYDYPKSMLQNNLDQHIAILLKYQKQVSYSAAKLMKHQLFQLPPNKQSAIKVGLQTQAACQQCPVLFTHQLDQKNLCRFRSDQFFKPISDMFKKFVYQPLMHALSNGLVGLTEVQSYSYVSRNLIGQQFKVELNQSHKAKALKQHQINNIIQKKAKEQSYEQEQCVLCLGCLTSLTLSQYLTKPNPQYPPILRLPQVPQQKLLTLQNFDFNTQHGDEIMAKLLCRLYNYGQGVILIGVDPMMRVTGVSINPEKAYSIEERVRAIRRKWVFPVLDSWGIEQIDQVLNVNYIQAQYQKNLVTTSQQNAQQLNQKTKFNKPIKYKKKNKKQTNHDKKIQISKWQQNAKSKVTIIKIYVNTTKTNKTFFVAKNNSSKYLKDYGSIEYYMPADPEQVENSMKSNQKPYKNGEKLIYFRGDVNLGIDSYKFIHKKYKKQYIQPIHPNLSCKSQPILDPKSVFSESPLPQICPAKQPLTAPKPDPYLFGCCPQKYFQNHSLVVYNPKSDKIRQFLEEIQSKEGNFYRYYKIYEKIINNSTRLVYYLTSMRKYDYFKTISQRIDSAKKNLIVMKIKLHLTLVKQQYFHQAVKALKPKYQYMYQKPLTIRCRATSGESKQVNQPQNIYQYFFCFEDEMQAIFAFTLLEMANIRSVFVTEAKVKGTMKYVAAIGLAKGKKKDEMSYVEQESMDYMMSYGLK